MRVVRLEREFRALVVTTVFLTGFNHQLSNAVAQTSAFSYQGRLSQNGSPATGLYDLRFTLYDAASNGTAIGGPLTNSAVGASNGLFTVLLDFGSATFNGSDRWLQVAVRTNGSPGAYPLHQLQNYPHDERPDTSVIAVVLAFGLTLATLLLTPLALVKIWLYCRELARPRRTRMLTAAALMSLALLAPNCYWIAFFIRARNAGG